MNDSYNTELKKKELEVKTLTIDIKEQELEQARLKTQQEKAKVWRERFVTGGSVAGFVSALVSIYLYMSKADSSKVQAAVDNKGRAIEVLQQNVRDQHEQTEKIRETVEDTTKAVGAIASSTPPASSTSIPVLDKEPVDRGCWTIYGGIVRCKGLSLIEGAVDGGVAKGGDHTSRPAVSVPDAPPPAPPPKPLPANREDGF